MKPITIQQVRQAVAGKALLAIPAETVDIRAVCTDTRRMEPASLYVALRGDRFDGHAFLTQAAAGGAIAAIVDQPPAQSLPNFHLIQVTDTRVALGKLARFVRKQMKSKVIAVAGSNGKTSTKHLIDAALRGKLRGSISPKSFNNDIGVPLTIFPADPLQDYLVLEMGTNHHGEIRVLTEMASPDIAVITNCGPEHLEGLDDLMGVRRENASIIEGLSPKGLLVFNGDDPEMIEAVAGYSGKKISFGLGRDNDLYASDIECALDGVRFRLNDRPQVRFVPMLGRHTALNALAAIAVARSLRLDEEDIFQSLQTAAGPKMRLQLQVARSVTILNDAYNANPASMQAALETISALPTQGRRVAIVGDMLELGAASDRYHAQIGQFIAANCPLDVLVCVGERGALIAQAAIAAGMEPDHVSHYAQSPDAARSVPAQLRDGDLVLLKASRGIHLEEMAKAIVANQAARGQRLAAS